MHTKLFIPGPVEVLPEVLEKMATPMIGHRSKACAELQKNTQRKGTEGFLHQERYRSFHQLRFWLDGVCYPLLYRQTGCCFLYRLFWRPLV